MSAAKLILILRENKWRDEWDTEAIDKFAELVSLAQWKVLIAKVRGYKERSGSRREGSPIPCFDLYDKNDDKVRLCLFPDNEQFFFHLHENDTV